MDSDSTADEDDHYTVPFSSSNEQNENFFSDENDDSRVFYFKDGNMGERTESSKADLVQLQTSRGMDFLTSLGGISPCTAKTAENLSKTPKEFFTDPMTEKCKYNEEKSAENEYQKMNESEKMLSVEMKKSCDVKNNMVPHHFQTEEKDELIRKMGNHIKGIWNILLQFGEKLKKADLLTEKEKLFIQREYEDGYLPLKISKDEGEKDNQLSLNRLLASSCEEPSNFSSCTNYSNSRSLNSHLKNTAIAPSDCHSSLSSAIYDEETSRNNINPSPFQTTHINNPVLKQSKARKSFTSSHRSHNPQDKYQQNMMPIPHNPLNSKNESVSSCIDGIKDPFQSAYKQAMHGQDILSKQKVFAEDASVADEEMSSTEIMETIQSTYSLMDVIQNDLVLSDEKSDLVKSNVTQNIFLCKNIKNLERTLVESPAINPNTAEKKMGRECDSLLKEHISASDISYSIQPQSSNDKAINPDAVNTKTLVDKLNNPFVKQAKARKKISKNQNCTHSLEENSHLKSSFSKGETSSLKQFDTLCPTTQETINSFHKCEENAFSMSDQTLAENQNGISSIKDSSRNETVDINFTNTNKLHSEFFNSPIVKRAKARKKFSKKQNLELSVNNNIQQKAFFSSPKRLNFEEETVSSFTENLKMGVSSSNSCNNTTPQSFKIGVYEEKKVTGKSQALWNTDGNTIELNPIVCGPSRDFAAANRDLHFISEDASKNNDFKDQNSLVVPSANDSVNEGNNDDLTQLLQKESLKISLLEEGSYNAESRKRRNSSEKNADHCGPDFLEEKNDNVEQSDNQIKNSMESEKDYWKNLDNGSTSTSEKLITSQTCSKNLPLIPANTVFENRSNPVNSSITGNDSSVEQPPDKGLVPSRGIFTLFQNSILNPFIEKKKARKQVTKKPMSASSLGDKVQDTSCNFSSEVLSDKMKTSTPKKEIVQISNLLPKNKFETSKENIKEYTCTQNICSPVARFINQTQDEERKSFIQNSSSIPSTSISQLETSDVHSHCSIPETEENTVPEDFDFVTEKNVSFENNFICKSPLQSDHLTSKDGVLTTENVTNNNSQNPLHSSKSIDLLKNDLAISDDETDDSEFEKDKNLEDADLTPSFSKNPYLISESKKVLSNDLNLGNNSSNLSNAECAYQNNYLPSTDISHNLRQTTFKLDSNTCKLQNSSPLKDSSYLFLKTNTSNEDPVKEKQNIPISPDTAGLEMDHGDLNGELVELAPEAPSLESTINRKGPECFYFNNLAKNAMKESFNSLSSEESSLSNEKINSLPNELSVSTNWEKSPFTVKDLSDGIKPGVHVLNNISGSKEILSSAIETVNSSTNDPLKKKLSSTNSVTACLAPIRVKGRTSQFRAFSKKCSKEFDENTKDHGYDNSNELQDNPSKNMDQDETVENYISIKKPKIRKEHQKIKNSNKTLISHNAETYLNLKETNSEYSARFPPQDAEISLKETAVSSEFLEHCKLFTSSKSHLMVQSSAEDKIVALIKTPESGKDDERIQNEKNTDTLFGNARPEKNMDLTSMKEKDLKDKSLELCSSVKPPSNLSNRESIVNGYKNILSIDKSKFMHTESECFTSKKRALNSEMEPVSKKQNFSRNYDSTIADSSCSKNISFSSGNLSVNDTLESKNMKEDWHIGSDSDRDLLIDESDNGNDLKDECLELCSSSIDPPPNFSSREPTLNISENILNSDGKIKCISSNSESFTSKKRPLNTDIEPAMRKQNHSGNSASTTANSSSSKNISTSSENFSAHKNSLGRAIEDYWHLENDSHQELVVNEGNNDKPETDYHSVDEHFQENSEKLSKAKFECLDLLEEIVPKFSKRKLKNNSKEGFIKKGSQKFPHAKLVEGILKNKNCASFKNEADLPFSLGIEEVLDKIRDVQANTEAFKNYVDSLTNFLSYPQNAPDTTVLIFLVVHYLHLRRVNPLIKFLYKQEGYPFLLSSENCIVTALIEIEKMAKPHLQGLIKSVLSVMYNLILEKKKLNVFGMSALCRVFTELCKRKGDKQKPISLCCDLLKQKHYNSPFLIASIAGVWKELFEIPDNFSDEHITLLSSIAYGAQRKRSKINKFCRECSSKLIDEYIAVPRIPNAKQAIEWLKEQIILKSLQGSFQNLWCLTSSLVILASCESYEWTEQILLNAYIVPNLKRFSSQDLNEHAFDLFCDLYVDVYFLAPTKFADKILIQFVESKVTSKEREFVQDCAAAALLKYLILAKRDVPAFLTVFFGKNPNNPKLKFFEDIVQRRIYTPVEKLSIKDVMIYV